MVAASNSRKGDVSLAKNHEFEGGEGSGETPEHAALVSAVHLALGSQLAADCRSYVGNLRLHTPTRNAAYPDVLVVRGPLVRDPADKNAITNPLLIIEVLSDDTEAYDRGTRFAHYRSCPSFVEYVLVRSHAPGIERFFKTGDGWTFTNAGPGEAQCLCSVDATLDVDAIYRGLVLPDGTIRVP